MIDHIDPREVTGGIGNVWNGDADNDTPALQWAIDQGKATGAKVMLPAARGYLHPPQDWTSNNLAEDVSLCVEGAGNGYGGSRLTWVSGTPDDIGFDCCGSKAIQLRHFRYDTAPGIELKCGLFPAASTANNGMDMTAFVDLFGLGQYANGALYGYAWGSSQVERCKFYNTKIGNQAVVYLSSINRRNVQSTFATVVTGAQGVTGIDWAFNEIHDQGQSFYSSCMVLDGVDTLKLWGGNMGQLGGSGPCQAYIQFAGNVRNIDARGVQFYNDSDGTPRPVTQYIAVAPDGSTGRNIRMDAEPENYMQFSVAKFGGDITG